MRRPQKAVVLLDAGRDSLAVLARRVGELGFRAVRVKTPDEAAQALEDVRLAVGALVIPPDLPLMDLRATLGELRRLAGADVLPVLAALQPDAPASERAELASAGADLPLFDPMDAHALRFQLNRAMAGPIPERRRRQARRAPASHEVDVHLKRRRKRARLYTFSTQAVYLATDAPCLRGSVLELELGLRCLPERTPGEVVMTNVPGNLAHARLPFGMAVRLDDLTPDHECELELLAEKMLRGLSF